MITSCPRPASFQPRSIIRANTSTSYIPVHFLLHAMSYIVFRRVRYVRRPAYSIIDVRFGKMAAIAFVVVVNEVETAAFGIYVACCLAVAAAPVLIGQDPFARGILDLERPMHLEVLVLGDRVRKIGAALKNDVAVIRGGPVLRVSVHIIHTELPLVAPEGGFGANLDLGPLRQVIARIVIRLSGNIHLHLHILIPFVTNGTVFRWCSRGNGDRLFNGVIL